MKKAHVVRHGLFCAIFFLERFNFEYEIDL
jgi:hypothetical protein